MGGRADPGGPGRTAGGLTVSGPAREPATLAPGSVVTLREVWQGHTIAARQVRVVEDVPHHHRAFYFSPGSRWVNDPRHAGEVRFSDGAWEPEPAVLDRPVLSFALPETAYAVLLNWDAGWRFEGYYVNVQTPLREHGGALEYTDWFLDVRIPPMRDGYEWKDEHELDQAIERGMLTPDRAHEVRWAGERAVEQVLLREPPFDLDWAAWRPDPAWGPLDLPAGSV